MFTGSGDTIYNLNEFIEFDLLMDPNRHSKTTKHYSFRVVNFFDVL